MTTTHTERDLTRRTRATLADGRELIYFDPATDPIRAETLDDRALGERSASGSLRLDVLTGDWVAMAGHRQHRTFLPPADQCPLCPTGRGAVASEIPAADYGVVVFENRFPSFSTVAQAPAVADDPLFATRAAQGRCEVVCFTSDHHGSFADLGPDRVRTVIDAWADRTRELGALPDVQHVFPFENRGPEIGVTLHHPHGQIYAYPYIPARTRVMLDRAVAHRQRTGRTLGADILEAEIRNGSRIVATGNWWTAYAPFASRWPVEVHLAPHRHVQDLTGLTREEKDELAQVYPDLLRRLDCLYTSDSGGSVSLPYIAGWHQAPPRDGQRDAWRLTLQITSVLRAPGRLKYLAGSESGAGAWVNDVAPEAVARRLREVAG